MGQAGILEEHERIEPLAGELVPWLPIGETPLCKK